MSSGISVFAIPALSAASESEASSRPEPGFRQVIPLEDARPRLRVIPFRAGARPVHEAWALGEGCSQHIGLFDSRRAPGEDTGALWLLYEVHPGAGPSLGTAPLRVRMSVWLLPDSPEDGGPRALPGLLRREVPLCQPPRARASGPEPREVPSDSPRGSYVAALPYAAVREGLERLGREGGEAFSLAHLFHRRFRVLLELCAGERVLSGDVSVVELHDLGGFGSLYQRVFDGLVRPDARAQASRPGMGGVSVAHHPWYPVLTIGMDKARLYLEAIESDVSRHTTHLPDPRWLVRVGLYLELLTCLGIIEAVRGEGMELLSPAERHQWETAPALAPVRAQLDVEAWREVWALRHIAAPSRWWPLGARNLLRKHRATLAFLKTHHEDLERALVLAGPALGGSHETWLRVFRDAERAVLRNADAVFPELRALPAGWRQWALWRECGDFAALGFGRVPGWLSRWVGDRDGVFASASREYRRSMNAVAHRARERGWMDWAGEECLPREASLIERFLEGCRRLPPHGPCLRAAAGV